MGIYVSTCLAALANFAGGLVIIVGLGAVCLFLVLLVRRRIPGHTILEADFEKAHVEQVPEGRLGRWVVRGAPVIRDVVEALRMGSEDKRVSLLVAKVGASGMKIAKVQEIRDAVIRFRSKGKKAVAYAETFGEFGQGNAAYYLASAFDVIYLQPTGDIGLTGLSVRTPFLRDLLQKVGVEPQVAFRKEYKSAAYTLTERGYTQPHREADEAVLKSWMSQIVLGIAQSRNLSIEAVQALFDSGPFPAARALQERLVDSLAYRDEVFERARKEAGKNPRFLTIQEYLRRRKPLLPGRKSIALIYGVGQIARGKSRFAPVGRFIMGSDTVGSAFRAAVRDKNVRSIIFRIDSPGGSYVASDSIWRETICARKAGKPVIVSMSDVAASGGYFVAMAADRIIAQPGTITGSIGVLSGKMVASQLWEKIGVRWGELFTNKNADLWSDTRSYSSEQWSIIQGWLDEIYEDFLKKAAEGRGMDLESVRRAAKGRVWTGRDAKEMGLLDELGGLHEAISAARAAARIPDKERIRLKVFPPKRHPWKRVSGSGAESSEADLDPVTGWPDALGPLVQLLTQLAVSGDSEVLLTRSQVV